MQKVLVKCEILVKVQIVILYRLMPRRHEKWGFLTNVFKLELEIGSGLILSFLMALEEIKRMKSTNKYYFICKD